MCRDKTLGSAYRFFPISRAIYKICFCNTSSTIYNDPLVQNHPAEMIILETHYKFSYNNMYFLSLILHTTFQHTIGVHLNYDQLVKQHLKAHNNRIMIDIIIVDILFS